MAAIAAQLATIQAGTVVYAPPYGSKAVDYWTTPSLVTLEVRAIQQYDQPLAAGSPTTQLDLGPVLSVVRSSGSTFKRDTHVEAVRESAGYEHQQRVMIWGYVKATAGDIPDANVIAGTLIERLWQDCVECLLVDRTFDGAALGSGPDDEGALDTDDGQLEPLGFFAQDWLVVA